MQTLNETFNTKMEWVEEQVRHAKGYVKLLKEAETHEENFEEVKDEAEFELGLGMSRMKAGLRDVRATVEGYQQEIKSRISENEEKSQIISDLQHEVAVYKEKEIMGPILAAEGVQRLLMSGIPGAPPPPPPPPKKPPCSCAEHTTASDHCPHRETLANKVIDGVFDRHTLILRKKVKSLEAELAALKATPQITQLEEEILSLKTDLEAVSSRWVEASNKHLSAKVEADTLRSTVADLESKHSRAEQQYKDIQEEGRVWGETIAFSCKRFRESVAGLAGESDENESSVPSMVSRLLADTMEYVKKLSQDLANATSKPVQRRAPSLPRVRSGSGSSVANPVKQEDPDTHHYASGPSSITRAPIMPRTDRPKRTPSNPSLVVRLDQF